LTTFGLVMLVVTPLVYWARTESKHVRTTRAIWWPTAWMIVPLGAVIIGVLIMLAASNLVSRRRTSRTASPPPT
jgi:hypothetical protein